MNSEIDTLASINTNKLNEMHNVIERTLFVYERNIGRECLSKFYSLILLVISMYVVWNFIIVEDLKSMFSYRNYYNEKGLH